jgi:hypothetical protein
MTVIKNLGRHSLPPLRRISSRDSKLQEEVRKWFWDRGVTQEIQLALLHSRAWLVAVVVDSGAGVFLVLLGVLLSGVRALLCVMPGLYTIVAQTGWDFSGLGDLLLGFLDKAEPLPFLFFLFNLAASEHVALAGS